VCNRKDGGPGSRFVRDRSSFPLCAEGKFLGKVREKSAQIDAELRG
jgi:hypothetical protein